MGCDFGVHEGEERRGEQPKGPQRKRGSGSGERRDERSDEYKAEGARNKERKSTLESISASAPCV